MRKLFPLMTVLTIFIAILLVSMQTVYAASPMLNTPLIEGKKPPKHHSPPQPVTGTLSISVEGYAHVTPHVTTTTTTTTTTSGAMVSLYLEGTYRFKAKNDKPIKKAVRLDITGLILSIEGVTTTTTTTPSLSWTGKGTYNLNNGRIQIHCSATSGDTKYNLILHGRVEPKVSLSATSDGSGLVSFTSPQSKLVITQSDGSATVYFLTLETGNIVFALTP